MNILPSTVMDSAAAALVRSLDEVPAPSEVKPGWIALGVVVALSVATLLLWLSMRRQLGKIRFDEESDQDFGGDPAEQPDGDADRPTPP